MSDTHITVWHCARCSRPETETGPLQTTPRAFRRPALLCARCRHLNARAGGTALWGLLIVPSAFVWLSPVLAPQLDVGSFQKFGGLYVLESVFVLLHELGHAVAGRLSGYRIEQIRLGYGALVSTFRLAGVEWQLRLLPYGGLCFGIPRRPKIGKLNQSAFVLGGPAVNALLATLGWWLWKTEPANTGVWWWRLQIPWLMMIGNSLLLLWSLLPIWINDGARRLPNDCLILWQIWFSGGDAKRTSFARRDNPRRAMILYRIASILLQALGILVIGLGGFLGWLTVRQRTDAKIFIAAGIMIAAGIALFSIGRAVCRPRLRASRELSSTKPSPVTDAYYADVEKLNDGLTSESLQSHWMRSESLCEQGRPQEALVEIQKLLTEHPGSLGLNRIEFHLLSLSGRTDDAFASLERTRKIDGIGPGTCAVLDLDTILLLCRTGRTREVVPAAESALGRSTDFQARIYLLEFFAGLPLLAAYGEFLEPAEQWSLEAMNLDPSPTTRATRGGVLYELGRIGEAEPLLRSVAGDSASPAELGLSNMYLALIANGRGEKRRARKLAWIAFNNYPDRRLVERLASDGLASG
jgi:hypothetical protein